MHLQLYVIGDRTLIPLLEAAWADFEQWVAVPFRYDRVAPVHVYSGSTDVSDYAQARVEAGVAEIAVTRTTLEAPRSERRLTLLHEAMHIAAFIGPLWHMNEAVKRLRAQYHYAFPHARMLANWMFEVDAELSLAHQFENHAKDRAEYYVRLEERSSGAYRVLPSDDLGRPYYVLRDRLCAELAGILANDGSVEPRLARSLEEPPDWAVDEMETLHTMLSPKLNNYADLPQWGVPRYEAVLNRVIDKLQRGRGAE
jgi:hypothetical protein